MYAKLIFRNARRSLQDYLIYIVTLMLCVAMFYAFLSITSSYYHPDLGVEYDLNLLSIEMKAGTIVITFLVLFLIRYANHFMIRQRQREFALQTIMGMERKTTANLFLGETMIMGIVSLVLGILLGGVCSQFITAMLLSSYGEKFQLMFSLFPDTILLTVCFFLLSFLIVGLSNIRTIRKIKIIDMLHAEQAFDKDLRQSRWIHGATLAFSLLLTFMLYTGLTKKLLYFDSRFPFPLHVIFWANILIPAVGILLLVLWFILRKRIPFTSFIPSLMAVAAAGCLFSALVPVFYRDNYLGIDKGTLHSYLAFLAGCFVYIVCCLFYLAGFLLLWLKEKNLKLKYEGENLFFFGQIISKLTSTSKTMTVICLTMIFSICLFLIMPALTGWASGYLKIRAVFDVQLFTRYNSISDIRDLPDSDYTEITDFLAEHNLEIADECLFELYLPEKSDFHERNKFDFPTLAMSLTDYNQLLKLRGLPSITLEHNEFTTQWQTIATDEEINTFLSENQTLSTDAGELSLAKDSVQKATLSEYFYNSYSNVCYILPDEICESLLAVTRNRFIMTASPIPYRTALALEDYYMGIYPSGEGYSIRTSSEQISSTTGDIFALRASMTYGAVVLLIICFTVLALQQLSEAKQYRSRYRVLRKMGVDESAINRLVAKQLLIWFGLPAGTAILLSGILCCSLFHVISQELMTYMGMDALLGQILVVMLVLSALLLCYLISTWTIFRKTIR